MTGPQIALPGPVRAAIARLEACGYTAFAVGGCVRDSLRGVTPHDWDLATAARPEQTCAALAGAFDVRPTGLRHGTVTALADGMAIEITTYRTEAGYADGRHPDAVRFVPRVEEDLMRRDFTVNAMAYHPARGLCDPFGGQVDLRRGVLRAVGDPDTRFAEDALRILRGVRFQAQTGFALEPQTAYAMRRQLARLDGIARERVLAELNGILTGRYAGRALRACREILAAVLPELSPMFGLCQHNPHHRYDVWEHTVRAVEAVPADLTLRWVMLLHDCGKPHAYTIDAAGVGHFKGHPRISCALAAQALARLRAPGALREAVCRLVELHDYPLGQNEKIVRRRLSRLGEQTVRQLLAIKKADCTGQGAFSIHLAELQQTESLVNAVCRAGLCLSLHDLALDGHDICALGFSGPAVGRVLRGLLDAVVDGAAPNEPEALRALAARWKEA